MEKAWARNYGVPEIERDAQAQARMDAKHEKRERARRLDINASNAMCIILRHELEKEGAAAIMPGAAGIAARSYEYARAMDQARQPENPDACLVELDKWHKARRGGQRPNLALLWDGRAWTLESQEFCGASGYNLIVLRLIKDYPGEIAPGCAPTDNIAMYGNCHRVTKQVVIDDMVVLWLKPLN